MLNVFISAVAAADSLPDLEFSRVPATKLILLAVSAQLPCLFLDSHDIFPSWDSLTRPLSPMIHQNPRNLTRHRLLPFHSVS